MDGSSYVSRSRASLVLSSPDGIELQYVLHFNFSSTNNVDEYKVLLSDIQMAKHLGALHPRAYNNSLLVTSQVGGEYKA